MACTPGTSPIHLVYLVGLVNPNKQDMLVDYLGILP
jgi:hypothetical protein